MLSLTKKPLSFRAETSCPLWVLYISNPKYSLPLPNSLSGWAGWDKNWEGAIRARARASQNGYSLCCSLCCCLLNKAQTYLPVTLFTKLSELAACYHLLAQCMMNVTSKMLSFSKSHSVGKALRFHSCLYILPGLYKKGNFCRS